MYPIIQQVGQRFKNFSVWHGRLPHWRADDVTYYVTFRHRRPLDEAEARLLLLALIRSDAKKWNLAAACVLPEATELIFSVKEAPSGAAYELSKIVEGAKNRASKDILKVTGERYPPFYGESYDRIIRDEAELRERFLTIVESPVAAGLAESPGEYDSLYVNPSTANVQAS